MLAFPAAGHPTDEPVRVFLRDGSFIQVLSFPEIRDGHAWIRIHPGGMLASLRLEEVDLKATRQYQDRLAEAVQEEKPLARPRGTVSGGAPPEGGPTITITPGHPAQQEPRGWVSAEQQAEHDVLVEYSERFTALSIRQEELMQEVGVLHVQKREFESKIRRNIGYPQVTGGLAKKLRLVESTIRVREEELRQTQSDLQELLNEAAARSLRLRRLPVAPAAKP